MKFFIVFKILSFEADCILDCIDSKSCSFLYAEINLLHHLFFIMMKHDEMIIVVAIYNQAAWV